MRLILCFGLLLSFSEAQGAAVEKRNAVTNEDGIYTDSKTFADIFNANMKASETKVADARLPFEVEFSYGVGSVTGSSLINNYYDLNLANQKASLSTFRIYASYEVWQKGSFFLSPGIGLGYGFKEDFFEATATGGGQYQDAIRLKWAPLMAGAKLGYRFPFWTPGMAFLRAGARYEWFSVAGALDGLTQSYWHLGYVLALGVNLWEDDPRKLDSWFGGVFLSAGTSGPFSSSYRGVKSNFFEAGLRFLL